MAEFRIDRLKFNWKGAWLTSKSYIKDDVIEFGGKVFVCLQTHTSSSIFYNDTQPSRITQTFVVTVGIDNLNNQSSGVFYLNGQETPTLRLLKGRRYVFNQNDISNKSFNNQAHPFFLSNVIDGTLNGGSIFNTSTDYFIDNVQVSQEQYIEQFAASNLRRIEITIPNSAPSALYYYSLNNPKMGGKLSTQYNSNWELMFDGYSWKGDWGKNTYYEIDNLIKYNGYIYQANIGHTSTNEESESFLDDLSNWNIYSKGYNWTNTWNTGTVYNQGDIVRYNGIVYECVEGHISADNTTEGLELDQSKWTIVSRSDDWLGDWQVIYRYAVDDLVKYGSRIYRCTTGHLSSTTLAAGLEFDLDKWQVVVDGLEYKNIWQTSVRYKIGDIVKYGPGLWRANNHHTSGSSLRDDQQFWEIYVPGLRYEEVWDQSIEYKQGDIVLYGGYAYTALTNNIASIPSANGILQDTGDWELLVAGYRHQGNWDNSIAYKTGDVIRNNGYLYIAVDDNTNTYPDTDPLIWQLLVPGSQWRADWQDNEEYFLGDTVTYAGTAYTCINRHVSTASDSRPDLDQELLAADYWVILIQGTPTNILITQGDIKTFDGTDTERLAVGATGTVLKSTGAVVDWNSYDTVPNVYYVSTNGVDSPSAGITLSAPFRTVKYATQYILNDIENRTPATIFIKTGLYQEQLPIVVPKDTALVGDELRSTVIQPAPGFEATDMFYVRNGSGIRNMTLQGLTGTLGEPNQYLTRRPTAGAYVSLDPGTGPSDTSVWITNKSCYVQNVSTFGTGCVGMKIDGSLHNGGNRSIVANDFTQILSDGVGYWALNGGRSELVSVFTYYCHIGYLAEDGGILRATNGNNSYGTYGSVAEGVDLTETPINGAINNRDNEAQVEEIFTFGTVEQQILALGYNHAGQDYSSASVTFAGSGINAAGTYVEYRNGAISNFRMLDPGDSSIPGGFGYQLIANNAQSGTNGTITIANADVGTELQYLGMRISILSGKGVGQYGEITGFNPTTKIVIVSRESDGVQGWDHYQPGWPIETTLDETTRYAIEPRVTVQEPSFTTSTIATGQSGDWDIIKSNGNTIIAIITGTTPSSILRSTDNGSSWIVQTVAHTLTSLAYTGSAWIAGKADSDTDILKSTDNGSTWTTVAVSGSTDNWNAVASDGDGNVIVAGATGAVRYSSDHGASWTGSAVTGTLSAPSDAVFGNGKFVVVGATNYTYSINDGANFTTVAYTAPLSNATSAKIAYGNGKFALVGGKSASGIDLVSSLFDPVDNWFSQQSDIEFTNVSYGNGVFLATITGGIVGVSQSATNYRIFSDDSTAYLLSESAIWTDSTFVNGRWIVSRNGSSFDTVQTGARPIVRARIENTRATKLIIYDTGSNYASVPTVSIYDSANTIEAVFETYVNDGVLSQPQMSNRGQGYVTATASITGNGFAEIYQIGRVLKLINVSQVPGVGANLEISGIDDKRYNVSTINDVVGDGPYSVTIGITPLIGIAESPDHLESLIIRERYSQIRLTGHDFLDIGTGNFNSTRYPKLYLEGETSENARQPFNEAVASGGGRVFYTSTDQDGNFRVGDLFQVEQARGVVTISATQFDLSGLSELRLGGIQVGGSAVVIREFSRDSTFIADSNNIVPTQKAIRSYVESRISGGGSNAQTNTLVAGQIRITGNTISTTSGFPINIAVPVVFKKGYSGSLLAQQYMLLGVNTQIDEIN